MPNKSPKELTQYIYQLAKEKNRVKLNELANEEVCLSVFHENHNAIMLLAKDKKTEAVDFLIANFNASLNHAVYGYALGGHVEQVDQLVEKGANPDYAVQGYAKKGEVDQVNKLLKQGASPKLAISGFALGGHVKQVEHMITTAGPDTNNYRRYAAETYARSGNTNEAKKLIAAHPGMNLNQIIFNCARGGHVEFLNELMDQQPGSRAYALEGFAINGDVQQVKKLIKQGIISPALVVHGYAWGGHVALVNQALKQGGNFEMAVKGYALGGHHVQVDQLLALGVNRIYAMKGYKNGGHLTQKNILRLMVLTNNAELRLSLASTTDPGPALNRNDVTVIFEKATKHNSIMKKYELNIDESRSLTVKGARSWLLQGPRLIKENGIILDIFWKITSIVLGNLPWDSAKRVFDAVHNHLFLEIKKDSLTGFIAFFRSSQDKNKLIEEAKQRLQDRTDVLRKFG